MKYFLTIGLFFFLFYLIQVTPIAYAQHYSDTGYSDSGYSDNTYSNSGGPPPSPATNRPPGPFGLNAPVVSCEGAGATDPRIRLRWTMSWLADDYVFYFKDPSVTTSTTTPGYCIDTSFDENGNPTGQTCYPEVTTTTPTTQGGWVLDTSRVYDLTTSSAGFIPGHFYGFVIQARNELGSKYSNTTPYNPAVPNGWSEQIYGWTQFPVCSPPGNFNLTTTASCPAVGVSRVNLAWTPASGSNVIYTPYYRPNLSTPETALASTNGYSQNVDSPTITAGATYQYIVSASSTSGTTFSNGAWSAGVVTPYCNNPSVNLTIDSGDLIKTINSGSTIQLNYSMTNSYTCTTTASPSVAGLTTPWTNLYPSNNAVTNPGSTSGSVNLTLYNNSTYPHNSYQFTLSCTNTQLPNSASNPASKTVTVNVNPDKAPFIQTTQGDVHSNQNINVPE